MQLATFVFFLLPLPVVYGICFFTLHNYKHLNYTSIVSLLVGNFFCVASGLEFFVESRTPLFLIGYLFLLIGISLGILYLKGKKQAN